MAYLRNASATILAAITGFYSVLFQLQGILILWLIHEQHQNSMVNLYLARKRNLYLKKLKIARRRRLLRNKRSCWYKANRTDMWWQNVIGGHLPDQNWKKSFRMSKNEFVDLCRELDPYISPKHSPNYRALSSKKKLAVTLYYLKDSGSIAMTTNTVDLAINTAAIAISDVCDTITRHLGPKYIQLPQNKEEMTGKVSEFGAKFGMLQAFGCVDGTHIPIVRPKENSQDYFCYKQYYSLNVLAVCDYKGTYMDVECVWNVLLL